MPALASARVVMFCVLLTSLFAFTAYSAKIVAILQTPSDAIRTIDDLTSSPMTLGIQETTYKKVYFAVRFWLTVFDYSSYLFTHLGMGMLWDVDRNYFE